MRCASALTSISSNSTARRGSASVIKRAMSVRSPRIAATELSRSDDGPSDSIRAVICRSCRSRPSISMTDSAGTSRIAGCGAGSLSSTRCLAAISAGTSRIAGCGAGLGCRARAAWLRSPQSLPGSPVAAPDRRRARVAAPRSRRLRRRSTRCPHSPRGDCGLAAGAAGRSIGRRGCAGAPVSRPLASLCPSPSEAARRCGASWRAAASLRASRSSCWESLSRREWT